MGRIHPSGTVSLRRSCRRRGDSAGVGRKAGVQSGCGEYNGPSSPIPRCRMPLHRSHTASLPACPSETLVATMHLIRISRAASLATCVHTSPKPTFHFLLYVIRRLSSSSLLTWFRGGKEYTRVMDTVSLYVRGRGFFFVFNFRVREIRRAPPGLGYFDQLVDTLSDVIRGFSESFLRERFPRTMRTLANERSLRLRCA